MDSHITFVNFPSDFGMTVPQRRYRIGSPVPDYVLRFHQDGHQGIFLSDALHQRITGIHDRDQRPVLTTTGSRITLRIQVNAR